MTLLSFFKPQCLCDTSASSETRQLPFTTYRAFVNFCTTLPVEYVNPYSLQWLRGISYRRPRATNRAININREFSHRANKPTRTSRWINQQLRTWHVRGAKYMNRPPARELLISISHACVSSSIHIFSIDGSLIGHHGSKRWSKVWYWMGINFCEVVPQNSWQITTDECQSISFI